MNERALTPSAREISVFLGVELMLVEDYLQDSSYSNLVQNGTCNVFVLANLLRANKFTAGVLEKERRGWMTSMIQAAAVDVESKTFRTL